MAYGVTPNLNCCVVQVYSYTILGQLYLPPQTQLKRDQHFFLNGYKQAAKAIYFSFTSGPGDSCYFLTISERMFVLFYLELSKKSFGETKCAVLPEPVKGTKLVLPKI